LGVGGGIAAYKAAELLRRLRANGCDVAVVPTRAALKFVGEPTWSALSGKPVSAEVWDDVHQVPHVRLGQQADLVVVAPATADLLARAAHGLADDLLGNVLLTASCPIVMAPAMHTEMWQHPATQENVRTLRERGIIVLDPAVGRLTGADSGPGRLPEPEDVARVCLQVLSDRKDDLLGTRILVSAGGTREAIDPVRYIGNRSSGKQGYAIAAAAVARGAEVTVVAANVELASPAGCRVIKVESAQELREEMHRQVSDADVVIMSAAVADFRPKAMAEHKIKKTDDGPAPSIELERTPDILSELVLSRGAHQRPIIVGFAAETGDGGASFLDHGRTKLQRKGCDLLVVNDVSDGKVFGRDENQVVILGPAQQAVEIAELSKAQIAEAILDRIVAFIEDSADK
jgi:phosphopantothenoylcysteine decarboxylase/phosphopantothenate--cysteine ligase